MLRELRLLHLSRMVVRWLDLVGWAESRGGWNPGSLAY
jgi:hypothetical protein